MFIFNTADPFNVLLLLAATILLIFLGKETKRSAIVGVLLIVYLVIIVVHSIQLSTIDPAFTETISVITKSLTVDFALICVAFFAYLWVDDIEARFRQKKSIDNSLDWFWKKV